VKIPVCFAAALQSCHRGNAMKFFMGGIQEAYAKEARDS